MIVLCSNTHHKLQLNHYLSLSSSVAQHSAASSSASASSSSSTPAPPGAMTMTPLLLPGTVSVTMCAPVSFPRNPASTLPSTAAHVASATFSPTGLTNSKRTTSHTVIMIRLSFTASAVFVLGGFGHTYCTSTVT